MTVKKSTDVGSHMPPNKEDSFSVTERQFLIRAVTILPLAKMIQARSIDPETITESQFLVLFEKLGNSIDTGFELYLDRVPEEIELVNHCLQVGEAKSAMVLLFTLIEGEVNALLRIHLAVAGFSMDSISEALKHIGFDTKLDVMLPLLKVTVPIDMRNTFNQCKLIRTAAVHNKAVPLVMSENKQIEDESEVTNERALTFFRSNPVTRLQRDLVKFIHNGIFENPSIQSASHLLAKYFVPYEE